MSLAQPIKRTREEATKPQASSKETSEMRLERLRPPQIRERLADMPVMWVPVSPLEWHSLHLPLGVDPLLAEGVASAACSRIGGVLWPTQHWGADTHRTLEQKRSLGLPSDAICHGMNFPTYEPASAVPSSYCSEALLEMLVMHILQSINAMGAAVAVLVNGHGGENHVATLQRLAKTFPLQCPGLRVLYAASFDVIPERLLPTVSHAGAYETSLMLSLHPDTVNLQSLPKDHSQPLPYAKWGIVDMAGFAGDGIAQQCCCARLADPRITASKEDGDHMLQQVVHALAKRVRSVVSASH